LDTAARFRRVDRAEEDPWPYYTRLELRVFRSAPDVRRNERDTLAQVFLKCFRKVRSYKHEEGSEYQTGGRIQACYLRCNHLEVFIMKPEDVKIFAVRIPGAYVVPHRSVVFPRFRLSAAQKEFAEELLL